MTAPRGEALAGASAISPRRRRAFLSAAVALIGAVCTASFAEEPAPPPDPGGHRHPVPPEEQAGKPKQQTQHGADSMAAGTMRGDGDATRAPRDPNAYADGYENGGVPGLEKVDQLSLGKLLGDQLEFLNGNGRSGLAWDVHAWYGPDEQRLWLRSEGGFSEGAVDYTTGAEALWWRAFTPFWATLLGVRQDFGPGSHTQAALGLEGLAPYWFELEATGYVSTDGRFSARLKGSYDLLFTNRLILTPEVETNIYSSANQRRGLGAGVGNVELSLRLRYELARKFAPYLGFDWDRALGSTADRLRINGEQASEARVTAGVRLWL